MTMQPGWYERQSKSIREDVQQWPEWMKRAAGISERNQTVKRTKFDRQITLSIELREREIGHVFYLVSQAVSMIQPDMNAIQKCQLHEIAEEIVLGLTGQKILIEMGKS